MAESTKDIKQEIATVQRDITYPAFGGVLRHQDDTLLTRGGGRGLKIYDDIERDCHAYAVLQKRKMAVISRPWQVDPASTSRIDRRAADLVKAQLDALDFDFVCLNLLDALPKGFAVGEIMWGVIGSEIVATGIKPRDQRRFGFDEDYLLRLKTLDNLMPGMELPDRKFIVHSFGAKDGNPYGLGLGSRLFWPVFFKRQGITFWLTFADKFGSPTALGKYPNGSGLPDQKKLLDALAAISQDAGVIVPEGMVIELLEATRGGATDTYEKLARYMDEEITMAVLGESATTKGGGGQAASAAITRNEVRLELVQADSDMLSGTLNKTLVKWITELNVPGATPPRVWRKVEEQKDLGAVATRDKTIFDMGFRPTLAYITETYGGGWTEFTPPPATPVIPAKAGIQDAAFAEAGTVHDAIDRLAASLAGDWRQVVEPLAAPIQAALDEAHANNETAEQFLARLPGLLETLSVEQLTEQLARAAFAARLLGEAGIELD